MTYQTKQIITIQDAIDECKHGIKVGNHNKKGVFTIKNYDAPSWLVALDGLTTNEIVASLKDNKKLVDIIKGGSQQKMTIFRAKRR